LRGGKEEEGRKGKGGKEAGNEKKGGEGS